jgi:hypothetical protein
MVYGQVFFLNKNKNKNKKTKQNKKRVLSANNPRRIDRGREKEILLEYSECVLTCHINENLVVLNKWDLVL